ncbi:hypothetical protein Mgra_00002881, partial [Meloidogyne graminicola]
EVKIIGVRKCQPKQNNEILNKGKEKIINSGQIIDHKNKIEEENNNNDPFISIKKTLDQLSKQMKYFNSGYNKKKEIIPIIKEKQKKNNQIKNRTLKNNEEKQLTESSKELISEQKICENSQLTNKSSENSQLTINTNLLNENNNNF